MVEWTFSILLIVIFAFLLKSFQLNKTGGMVIETALNSLEVLSSPQLSDRQKEVGLQKNSLKLFGLFFKLVFGAIVALALPLGCLWIADKSRLIALDTVLALTVSPHFLVVSTLMFGGWWFFNQRRQPPETDSSYSPLDQALHRMSFKTYATQVSVARLEDKLFAKTLAPLRPKPVFITALPRAGTTLLLECLADNREFAAHCYRDMPFVLIPCLWNRYSRMFQQRVEAQERAHGDGMRISPDSPEALEEVIWTAFWGKHYQADRIIPWDIEQNKQFNDFFRSHMRKIIFLRRHKLANTARYISKNNANIARIHTLRHLFPDAIILIPFRNPIHHAASMLQQHRNFLNIHKTDAFASEYMKAIGHYDFGENLCPIDFDGWLDQRISTDTESITFWLEYWVASYGHLLRENSKVAHFFNYDALCQDPEHGLLALGKIVDSNAPDTLAQKVSVIGSPRPKKLDTSLIPEALLQKANTIYQSLQDVAYN